MNDDQERRLTDDEPYVKVWYDTLVLDEAAFLPGQSCDEVAKPCSEACGCQVEATSAGLDSSA